MLAGMKQAIVKAFTILVMTSVAGNVTGCGVNVPQAAQPASAPPVQKSLAEQVPQTTKIPRMNEKTVQRTVSSSAIVEDTSKQVVIQNGPAPDPLAAIRVPILEYHDTTYISKDPWAMSQTQFAEEMAFLSKNGFHPVTLDQFHAAKYNHASLPSRPIIITFDDGYVSNFTNAYPVLQQYGFHATIFMVSGFIGHKGFLTSDQLKTMEDSGLVQIESHTVHHKNLSHLTQSQVMFELTQSKQALSQVLAHPVNYFCYPEGGYNWQVALDVQRAGYLLATTTTQGYANLAENPVRLHRIVIHEGVSLSQFATLLGPSLVQGQKA